MTRKYRNEPITLYGIRFDSKAEANRYLELKAMEQDEIIVNLELQPEFVLLEDFAGRDGRKVRGVVYRADFSYDMNGERIVEDVKGVKTKDFIIKWKFVQHQNPHIVFRLVR